MSCVVWNKTAENLVKYVVKGALIGVEGRIKVNVIDKDKKEKKLLHKWNVNLFNI
ncbi:single-stranded DNA-binding protein [Poinsettia branch-inducing phytoplasma]|uniref:single-stranded DNA-binding protein n=1 Tax=Poinsettia branch-inducing phytoplasma TaxID=138647 RepID=UPI000A033430|nr:single-stranded DNA-binding protein [Poinsettia branch-inducing phytoplasma]